MHWSADIFNRQRGRDAAVLPSKHCVFARASWCVTSPAPESNGEPCWNIHNVTLSLQYLNGKTTRIQPELPATLQPLSSAFSMTECHVWRQEVGAIGLCLEALARAEGERAWLTWTCHDQAGGCVHVEIRETDLRSLFRALICLSVVKYQSPLNPELQSGNVSPDLTVL